MDANSYKSRWTLDKGESRICSLDDVSLEKRQKLKYLNKSLLTYSGNIPNGDLTKGDLLVPYLQPFPPKGTGYHRHIFVLYKQEEKLDLSSFKVTEATDLEKRTFSTFEFYRQHQDQITPAGLSFFQVNWDDTLTAFYHEVLSTS